MAYNNCIVIQYIMSLFQRRIDTMSVTKKEYARMIRKASPDSNSLIDIPMAFLIGGSICMLGQAITNAFSSAGLDSKTSGMCTAAVLILISSLLSISTIVTDLF